MAKHGRYKRVSISTPKRLGLVVAILSYRFGELANVRIRPQTFAEEHASRSERKRSKYGKIDFTKLPEVLCAPINGEEFPVPPISFGEMIEFEASGLLAHGVPVADAPAHADGAQI